MIAPQSNMTLLIKKLRVKSFIQVERSACDGRAYVISITPAGLEVLTRIDNRFPEEKQFLEQISEEDAKELNRILSCFDWE